MIPIIIPAYEPDTRMLTLLNDMKASALGPVILVDDGSGESYAGLFARAAKCVEEMGGTILTHAQNRGKGRALKTGFRYVLDTYPDAIGAVTADSDGQHSPACIEAVRQALAAQPGKLVLGVRCFDGEGVPRKSRMGNRITEKVFSYVSGVHVTDTQTGLRGIPRAFMEKLLDVKGERFEFETQMLLESAGRFPIVEVPIQTIYDSKENHQSHFNTFSDSAKICKILAERFLKYTFSSLSSCVIDLILFSVFCNIFRGKLAGYVAVSTVLARVVSALYNYAVNYKIVFDSRKNIGVAGTKYFLLALVQMSLSALLVTAGCGLLPFLPEVAVKAVVDAALFFISYKVQQKYIF